VTWQVDFVQVDSHSVQYKFMTLVLSMNQLATREPVIGKLRSGLLFGFVKGYDVVDAEPQKEIGNCDY
jgi:hypothetical protein